MTPLEMIPRGFPLWVAVLESMAGFSRDDGIFCGGTGSWILDFTLALGSMEGMVS